MSLDFHSIIQKAEHAVQGVKDPALKAVAFGKVIDALVAGESPEVAGVAPRSVRREKRVKLRGASGGARKLGTVGLLEELVGQDYFRSQRSLSDVKKELANGGHHVPLTSLSGPMQALCKKRVLRREKKTVGNKQTYVYSNW